MINLKFIGIGSGKSGSTWLFENIREHPEICNRNPKEIRFFDLHYDRGFNWYSKQFYECDSLILGEFSVQYMLNDKVPIRIKEFYPNIRLIAILRNPIHRIYSDYNHSIRKGDISGDTSFRNYIENKENLDSAEYYKQLIPYYNNFDSEQIIIIILENAIKNPSAMYEDVLKHIGVNDLKFIPKNIREKVNEATQYKYLIVENIIAKTSRYLNNHGFTLLVERLKKTGIHKILRKINTKKFGSKEMNIDDQKFLKNYYSDMIKNLEELIGKKLDVWQ